MIGERIGQSTVTFDRVPTLSGVRWDLFDESLIRLGGGLLAGLAVIVLVTRLRGVALRSSSLFVRWRTWAIITPIWIVAVAHPAAALVLVVFLSVVAVHEYCAVVGLRGASRTVLLLIAVVSGPLALWDFASWRAIPPQLLLIATLPPLLAQDTEKGATRLAFTALGFAYLPYLLTHLLLVREHTPFGAGALLVVGVAVALSDVGAFTIGSAVGGGPLAEKLSPNKTRAGVLGNVIGAALGVAWTSFAVPDMPLWLLASVPFVVGLGAVWGDLLESLLKRQFDVKDAGAWLPGFGGLLDRIDSLLIVAPLTYTLFTVGPHVASWQGWPWSVSL